MTPGLRRLAGVGAAVLLLMANTAGLPGRDAQTIDVTIREGTSMAAAVSPDGRTIAIDLLGRIWTLPIAGGAARPLIDELFDARQPAWSPDNTRIAFQSYREGTWDIWEVASDGSGIKNLTSGPFDDREPTFSHDGARLAFSSDRSGNYDIWELDLKSGALHQLSSHPGEDFAPAYSPDDRDVAFVSSRPGAPGVYTITRSSGVERQVVSGSGTLSAPSWRPGGTQLTYAMAAPTGGRLMVGDQPVTTAENVFPFRAHWLSATDVVYTADGKIKRRVMASTTAATPSATTPGSVRTIEFTAALSFTRPATTVKRRDFDSTVPRATHGIVSPVISPDGRQVAFAALGDLFVMTIGQVPRPLTHDPFVDLDPTWSPDGSEIAFSSDRAGTMSLWIHNLATGVDRRATPQSGAATNAAWSPDGASIAFVGGSEIRTVDVRSGAVKRVHAAIANGPGRPSWSPDGRSLVTTRLWTYSARFREGLNQVTTVSLDGRPDRGFFVTPDRSVDSRIDAGPVWSPDGRTMALVMDGVLCLVPVDATGTPTGPVRKLTTELAASPTWTADSKQILYIATDRLKLLSVDSGQVRDVPLDLQWQLAVPRGHVVVHAGRLVDGLHAAAQTEMDIVVEGQRIRSVEPHRAALHTGRVVDASNEVVMPGLIEMHAHLTPSEPQGRLWLSYGITSVRNPGGGAYYNLEHREAIDAGVRPGPRIFTNGYLLDGTRIFYSIATSIGSAAQLEMELDRARRLEYDFLKTYVRLPDALQQRAIAFGLQAGLPLTSHEYYPAVAFGAAGTEHTGATSRRGYSPKNTNNVAYADVLTLFARSGMTITPTSSLGGATPATLARDASYQDDPRYRTFYPNAARELARDTPPRTDRIVTSLDAAGVTIVAGTDGPLGPFGVALHVELEMYQASGLSPLKALQTATVNAAEALGMGADLGSIEPGKLADLVMVSADPLLDIRHARRVTRVMKNAELFEMERLLRPAATTR